MQPTADRKTDRLKHSTSANHLQLPKPDLKRKKSWDGKNKEASRSSAQEPSAKLQMFLRVDSKPNKGRAEYDCSAIFEASKSKIQSRNRTTV